MKDRISAGLIGAGGVNRSFLARMPALLERIGPVKGSSLRVSRRISNGLRSGFGVADYADFSTCNIIWLAVPELSLDAIEAELASAVSLRGKIVVRCDAMRDSFSPSPLRTAGARVATLNCVPEMGERIFVADGPPDVLAELRKLLAGERRKLIELNPAAKPLYVCGMHLTADLLLPLIAGAVEGLRAAGFSREEATRVVETMGSRALRSYVKAGPKAWKRLSAERSHRAIMRDFEAIRLTDPKLAGLAEDGYQSAVRYFTGTSRKRSAGPRTLFKVTGGSA
jgi:hypothetical protein